MTSNKIIKLNKILQQLLKSAMLKSQMITGKTKLLNTNLEVGENGPDILFKSEINHSISLIQTEITTNRQIEIFPVQHVD